MSPVWIIDDDSSIRWVLEKALGRENIRCRSFDSADAALAALSALGAVGKSPVGEAPCVLLSDIRMPGSSGLDLLREAKQRYPDLPVIIMTAYSDLDSAVSAFQGGAFEYLPKPFDVDQALELVRQCGAFFRRLQAGQKHCAAGRRTVAIVQSAPRPGRDPRFAVRRARDFCFHAGRLRQICAGPWRASSPRRV